MSVGLAILLEPERGDPVTLAEIEDQELLITAALEAIHAAEEKARQWQAEDKLLGQLQQEEAARLRRALEMAVPGLRARRGGSEGTMGGTR